MEWMKYAVLAAIALASADVCLKLASDKISHSVGMLLYGSCTFLTGLGWVLWLWAKGVPQQTQGAAGILPAIGVGISFSCVTLGLYAAFGTGAPLSSASPVIRLGGLLLASLVGLVLLREPISWRYAIGVFLACAGVYLIITR